MQKRQLGNSGLSVSVVGLGCNNFGGRIDAASSRRVIDSAIEAGITFFDTADIYGNQGGSETIIGEALRGRRDRVVLATKFGMDMGDSLTEARASRHYIRRAVEASLRRLQTDYVDLYQLHIPDGLTPFEETLAALTELVDEGKVRYIGSSQFTAWQVVDADHIARRRHLEHFVSAQNYYNLLGREAERELLPACVAKGIGVLPFFPLAWGLLTGKYRRGQSPPTGTRLADGDERLTDANFDLIESLEGFAQERGHSLLDLAFAGLLAQAPVASVIAGATKPEQIAANVAAGQWELTHEDHQAMQTLLPG